MKPPPSMTLDEKIGQLFVLRVYGPAADTTDPTWVAKNQAAYGVDNAVALISAYQPGGIVYFRASGNVVNPVQIAELSNALQHAALSRSASSPIPVLIGVDQEGGRVARMSPPVTWFPSARMMAMLGEGTAEETATITATELRALGIHLNFAPVADVILDADNEVIGDRSFASDTETAVAFVRAQVRGLQRGGVLSTVKHFPGHGDTAMDTHTGRAVITHRRDTWEHLDLPPFRAAIEAGVDALMVGHLVFPALDPSETIASTSHAIITDILRGEIGFDGVVVTDGLGMGAVRLTHDPVEAPLRALQAGADQLLTPADDTFPAAIKLIRRAVENGDISIDRIDESVTRILRLKKRAGLLDQTYVSPDNAAQTIGCRAHQQVARRISTNLP